MIIVTGSQWQARSNHCRAPLAHGSPEPMVNMYLGYFAASRQGEFATVDPTLARLIGRPPLTLRAAVKATLQMEK